MVRTCFTYGSRLSPLQRLTFNYWHQWGKSMFTIIPSYEGSTKATITLKHLRKKQTPEGTKDKGTGLKYYRDFSCNHNLSKDTENTQLFFLFCFSYNFVGILLFSLFIFAEYTYMVWVWLNRVINSYAWTFVFSINIIIQRIIHTIQMDFKKYYFK